MSTLRDLLGKPWECPSNPPDSFDCWALVWEVRTRNGIVTPAYVPVTRRSLKHCALIARPPKGWKQLDAPTAYCVVRMGDDGSHVGAYLEGGDVIHTQRGGAVSVDRLDLLKHMGERVTFWEFQGA